MCQCVLATTDSCRPFHNTLQALLLSCPCPSVVFFVQMFRRVGPAAVRLLLLPGLVEAFVTGGAAMGIMRMPVFWAFTQGFILKAVGEEAASEWDHEDKS